MTQSLQQGFLITRNSRDRSRATELEYWVTTDQGPAKLIIKNERPVFFIAQSDHNAATNALKHLTPAVEVTPLPLKLFNGETVSAIYTHTINDQFTVKDLISYNGIPTFETDFRLHDRYLIERFAMGAISFVGNAIQKKGYVEYQNCRIKQTNYTPKLKLLSVDIECSMEGELYSVGLSNQPTDQSNQNPEINEVLMSGNPESCDHTKIYWFENEAALIKGFIERITQIDPDLLIGWNFINFDMRLLIERAGIHKISFNIGRGNTQATWRDAKGDPTKGYAYIPGRLAIDGIDSLKSATWSFPSFSLENVSQTLLNRGKKVDQDVDDRFNEIKHNFEYNKTALAAYNLEDCRLVLDIFEHTNIVDFLILRSQITGLELDRAGGSVAAFTNLYLPRLHRAGYIAPNLPADGGLASPGGYVMDSKPGLYHNVLVFDFKSLYPAIIRTFKIDPMGLIEGLADEEHSIEGFLGAKFHRENHFLPKIITDLWRERDQAKKDNDSVRSQAIKILMNSFYGVLGSGGCRFYDQRLASSITMRGHEIMQTTKRWVEEQGYEVIYGDTDSTFVALDPNLSAAECRTIGEQIEKNINQQWQAHLEKEFNLDCQLELEFETLFNRFLMPTVRGSESGSKKRYAGLLINDQDGAEKIIFKGLENVRTDWTDLAKNFQAKLFDLVFHDQDPTNLVRKTVDEVLAGERAHELTYRKQLRRKLSSYVKNVPPHVKAARLADQKSEEKGRSLKYQNKGWITYAITTSGPESLEYLESPIDYDHYIDKQLKPVADAILPFVGLEFDSIISNQAELF